jgi:hypothetical protein
MKVPKALASIVHLWGELAVLILGLYKGLSKKARIAFIHAVISMSTAGVRSAKQLTSITMDWSKMTISSRKYKKRLITSYPMAWRERLAELRGYLPAFENVEGSTTKNPGARANKAYPGLSSRYRTNSTSIENLGPDDDPVIGIRQYGYGPWVIVNGFQAVNPTPGIHKIEWHLLFLSGRVAISTVTIKDGKAIRFGASKADQPWFLPIKGRMAEFVKFGPKPVQLPDGRFRDTYTLDHPVLLDPNELEELKGLLAAEKAMEYLEISKTAKGKARRGTKESLAKEPSTEEDLFRERRAAKAYQKRTNRDPRLGIGEYAGGYDADPEIDIEDQDRTWPSREDRALGREHPARHFRLSLFGRMDNETKTWVRESKPVYVDRKTLAIVDNLDGEEFEWVIKDMRGLTEAVYQELEWGDLLFWAESYRGKYGYAYEHLGIRIPRPSSHYTRLVPKRVKVQKPHLPCKDCGHPVWRQDLHAEVCDNCESEGFPRTSLVVLIPVFRLRSHILCAKGASHIQVRLYGRAVKWVLAEALRLGVDITKPKLEESLMPIKALTPRWSNIDPGWEASLKTQPVGFGRFLWGRSKIGPWSAKD